jgi:DNA-binding NarL/FixJ family response regulator
MPVNQPVIEVLLVEDNPDDVFLFKAAMARIRDRRFCVSHADRLSNALERLRVSTPDVVVTDLNLPDSLGTMTVKLLVENADATPVIALTGWEDPVLGAQLIDEGASAFWSKDRLIGTDLPKAIVALLEQSRSLE